MLQCSPPLGTVTVIWPPPMVKSASLVSETPGSTRLVILILACVVAGPETVQEYEPSLGVLALITVQGRVPPVRDTSIFTLPERLVEFHVTLWVVPMPQTSPPFGEITVM